MGVVRVEIRQPGQDPFVIVVDREVEVGRVAAAQVSMTAVGCNRLRCWPSWRWQLLLPAGASGPACRATKGRVHPQTR